MRECDPQVNPFAGIFQATAGWVKQRFRLREIYSALLKGEATARLAGVIACEREPGRELSHESSAIPWH
jgi:hypothetical protein